MDDIKKGITVVHDKGTIATSCLANLTVGETIKKLLDMTTFSGVEYDLYAHKLGNDGEFIEVLLSEGEEEKFDVANDGFDRHNQSNIIFELRRKVPCTDEQGELYNVGEIINNFLQEKKEALRMEGRMEVAIKMLDDGMHLETVARYASISTEELGYIRRSKIMGIAVKELKALAEANKDDPYLETLEDIKEGDILEVIRGDETRIVFVQRKGDIQAIGPKGNTWNSMSITLIGIDTMSRKFNLSSFIDQPSINKPGEGLFGICDSSDTFRFKKFITSERIQEETMKLLQDGKNPISKRELKN